MDLKYYAEGYVKRKASKKENRKTKLVRKYLHKNSKVLDIGCAGGEFYDKYKDIGIDYYGIDYNKYMVDCCVNEKNLNCLQCDISRDQLPYQDNTFDFVYCSHVLEHILSNEQILLFQGISRVLKPGGTLLLFTPTPYNWYFFDDPTHQRPSTHGSLEHLCKNFGLNVICSKYSNIRWFPQYMQRRLRLPPLRWFLWEVFLVAKK